MLHTALTHMMLIIIWRIFFYIITHDDIFINHNKMQRKISKMMYVSSLNYRNEGADDALGKT